MASSVCLTWACDSAVPHWSEHLQSKKAFESALSFYSDEKPSLRYYSKHPDFHVVFRGDNQYTVRRLGIALALDVRIIKRNRW